MKYGARNRIWAKFKSIKKGEIMSLVKFSVTDPHDMASVLTTESVDDLKIEQGDEVELITQVSHPLIGGFFKKKLKLLLLFSRKRFLTVLCIII